MVFHNKYSQIEHNAANKPYIMRRKRHLPIYYCIAGSAIFCIIFGTVILIVWPRILNKILHEQLVLRLNSKTYDVWIENPFPLKIDFYFFNWTNPQDYKNNSVKPHFEQIGPYRFTETKKKVNVTFNNNDTVTYRHQKTWFFDETFKEGRNLTDTLVTINPVALSAAYTIRNWNPVVKGVFSTLTPSKPQVIKTVAEMLFDGYSDPLLDMGKNMPLIDTLPPIDKFGWFYSRNDSIEYDGVFNSGTGTKKNDLGTLYKWNYWEKTPYYLEECGRVRGSAGELFPRGLNREFVSFFSPDMCKTVDLDYEKSIKVKGVLGYKYSAGSRLLDNGTLLPENKCNCIGDCLPSGVLNISTCRYGSPGFVSLPHFYKADPYYLGLIDGLDPTENNHSFYMILEPNTGIPLEVSARLQINLFVQPIHSISLFEDIPRRMFPMLWFEQKVTIPDDMAFQLSLLVNFPVIFMTIGITAIFLGLFMISCVCYKICTVRICVREDMKISREQVPLNFDEHGRPIIIRNS